MISSISTGAARLYTPRGTARQTEGANAQQGVIQVYLLDDKCIYSGGQDSTGQSVHVMYTDDSTAEDPIARIFGHAHSGAYEEIVHINDIDPSNATYPELCALLGHKQRTGEYSPDPTGKRLLRPVPVGIEVGDYARRMDYLQLLRDGSRDTNFVDLTHSADRLTAYFEQWAAERSVKAEEAGQGMPFERLVDQAGRLRVRSEAP